MELAWMQTVERFCRGEGLPAGRIVERLRAVRSETYLLAHQQFVAGASDRVVFRLLRAAVNELPAEDE